MDKEHYVTRHTGEFIDIDIKHVPAKPWRRFASHRTAR